MANESGCILILSRHSPTQSSALPGLSVCSGLCLYSLHSLQTSLSQAKPHAFVQLLHNHPCLGWTPGKVPEDQVYPRGPWPIFQPLPPAFRTTCLMHPSPLHLAPIGPSATNSWDIRCYCTHPAFVRAALQPAVFLMNSWLPYKTQLRISFSMEHSLNTPFLQGTSAPLS